MIFDGHSDLFLAIQSQIEKGKRKVIDNYYDEMKVSNMIGGIFVMYLPNSQRYYENFEVMFDNAVKEIKESLYFKVVKTTEDLLSDTKRVKVILGAESLMPLQYNVSLLEEFYNKGLRHAMLTWNEENELATGVRGDKFNGLKEKGVEYIKKMEQLNMIIDLSHLNERSFYDVMDIVKGPVICSHSNCFKLCEHPRNLKDKQILKIKEKKGLISVTAVPSFVSEDPKKQNIQGLVEHIVYLKNLIGVDHIGLGFDYMGFYGENEGNLNDLYNFSHSHKIIDELLFNGFNKEEIEKITYKNYFRVISEILGTEE